jgi:DNA-binding NarL/FixJ family response regulator
VRILVVDDSPAVRARLVAMLVEVPGVELREVDRASQALEVAGDWLPDVVVLDLSMPDRSGLEILPAMKSLPVPPTVIVLTNHCTSHHMRRCLAMGADFFFDKSRDFGRVVEIVRLRRG